MKGEWLLQEKPDYFNPEKVKNQETRRALQAAEKRLVKDLKNSKDAAKATHY